MPNATHVTISSMQPDRDWALLVVRGAIDGTGLAELCQRVDGLLVGGVRYLVVELSEAGTCGPEVLGLLAEATRRLRARSGWLRLVGDASSALAELGEVDLVDLFAVYHASRQVRRVR